MSKKFLNQHWVVEECLSGQPAAGKYLVPAGSGVLIKATRQGSRRHPALIKGEGGDLSKSLNPTPSAQSCAGAENQVCPQIQTLISSTFADWQIH